MQNEMSLDGYGVTPLILSEQKEIDGGIPPWMWQAAVGTFVYNVFGDWSENVAAFNQGRTDAK
jgi:hypothetical protein